MAQKQKRGFALMNKARLAEVSARGGARAAPESRTFHRDRELASEAGKLGNAAVKNASDASSSS